MLKEKREKKGALTIQNNELNFSIKDNELVIFSSEHIELHDTIAEMMILGNELVARKIHNIFPEASLLRIHPPPDKKKFKTVDELVKSRNLTLDLSSDNSLFHTLQQLKLKLDDNSFNYINTILTRSLSEALYICSGSYLKNKDLTTANISSLYSHFGLGLDYYTHFTSPIRRYADLLVHRLLIFSLEYEKEKKKQSNSKSQKNITPSLLSLPEDSTISMLDSEDVDKIDEVFFLFSFFFL